MGYEAEPMQRVYDNSRGDNGYSSLERGIIIEGLGFAALAGGSSAEAVRIRYCQGIIELVAAAEVYLEKAKCVVVMAVMVRFFH